MAGLVIHLIPHTHWDREWYLPRAAFVARLVPALDDLLTRLETDPDFRSFLSPVLRSFSCSGSPARSPAAVPD